MKKILLIATNFPLAQTYHNEATSKGGTVEPAGYT
jgi:hypothetical protein